MMKLKGGQALTLSPDLNYQQMWRALSGGAKFLLVAYVGGERLINVDEIAWVDLPAGTITEIEKQAE